MIRYGNSQEVEEYFADKSANQSYLKTLVKGVDFITKDEKKMYYEEKGHFIIGSGVDVLITQGEPAFNEQYYVFNETVKPSDTIMSMIQMIFDNSKIDGVPAKGLHLIEDADVLVACDAHTYQARWKEETRIAKVREQGEYYFSQLKEAVGKQILSEREFEIINNIVISLKSNIWTSTYFQNHKDIDIYFQVPIYFSHMDIPCKALLDMVVIDKQLKTITPIDLKTMGGYTSEFEYAFKKRGYDFQAAFYTIALKALVNGFASTTLDIDLNVDVTYSTKAFRFIVETTKIDVDKTTQIISRFYQGKPLVFEVSPKTLDDAYFGVPELTVIGDTRPSVSKSYPIRFKEKVGVLGALELYKWHKENGVEVDKKIMECEGVIEI